MKRTTKLVSVLLAVLLAFSSFAVLPTLAYEHSSKAPGSEYEFGDVNRDDEVLLWGKDLPVEQFADMTGTINYELVCGVSHRVKRIKKAY